jgi:hypothetical protein
MRLEIGVVTKVRGISWIVTRIAIPLLKKLLAPQILELKVWIGEDF